jgi:hypothetical protein
MPFIQYLTPTPQEIVDMEIEEIYQIVSGGGPISIGQAVCFDSAGGQNIRGATTRTLSCKGKFVGIALQNGNDGDYINVQTGGEFEDNSFSFSSSEIGAKVYYDFAHTVTPGDPNLTTVLSTIESDFFSNHFQIIGKVLGTKKILIKEEPAVTK